MKTKPKDLISSKKKRILLVDDHPLMREGLTQWINRTGDLEVCGEAESAAQAMSRVERLKPDLVLIDISLAGGDGLELIKSLRAVQPDRPMLVLSMHDESLNARRALRAGARGYIMKRVGGERVVEAIREVFQGRIVVSPVMATHLLEEYSGNPSPSGGQSILPNLTDRELEVLQLIGEAKSNREIAERLHLSHKTVETHRLNVMRKLKLRTTAKLLRFAMQFVDRDASGNLNAVRLILIAIAFVYPVLKLR
ncbi:MAG TPA: response regulator transcription factor [Candidatus Sulfotelmatobacter sp.]|nr:response regulator transcription factor [Candidatus Sulfotelmatobacter sp.]